MELNLIVELINGIGFPAAVVVALFWSNRETVKRYENVMLEFKNTIDANTRAIQNILRKG